MPVIIQCLRCGKDAEAQRRNRKKFCSNVCATRHKSSLPKERNCRHCGKPFPVETRGDANRQHCSRACAKAHNTKRISTWHAEHPDEMKQYQRTRAARSPGLWREKARAERAEAIRLLGGQCCVCGVSNPYWLHVDYVPTNRHTPHRHPRHLAFVRRHLVDFRLICANHHYELSLTGRIEGTEIIQ